MSDGTEEIKRTIADLAQALRSENEALVRDEMARVCRDLEIEQSKHFEQLKILVQKLLGENTSLRKMITDGHFIENMNSREKLARQELFYNAFKALTFNSIDGDYVEFGCHGCMTFPMAYHEAARHGHKAKLWAFDSFQGFPPADGPKDMHPRWAESKMSTSIEEFHRRCEKKGVPNYAYNIVPGFYDKTLQGKSDIDDPVNICLAFIDCDMYSSTKYVLNFMSPRLKHGMIIAFDDYHCWSAGQLSGERRAMMEIFAESHRWRLVPYMRFGWHGASFFVEDLKIIG
jgi:hypothetical protein